mmetsp:Transcript_45484/g.98708  ORF Transcript_45484/g.98708 Transcript_45484/m.98708 type:complete len:219 (+) Transcript_45484:338-994(+)
MPIMHPTKIPTLPEATWRRRTCGNAAWALVNPDCGRPHFAATCSTVFPIEIPNTSAKVLAIAAQANVDNRKVPPIKSSTASPPTIMMLLSSTPKITNGRAALRANHVSCLGVGVLAVLVACCSATVVRNRENSARSTLWSWFWSTSLRTWQKSRPKWVDSAATATCRRPSPESSATTRSGPRSSTAAAMVISPGVGGTTPGAGKQPDRAAGAVLRYRR